MKKKGEELKKESDVVKPKEDCKSFYGTLLACMVGITIGFFIQHINEHNVRALANPHDSYADVIVTEIPPILGHLMLLTLFGIAIVFPSFWWLINRNKLKNNIIDALFVASVGAFPFFVQNCVACAIQLHDKTNEGLYDNNLIYVALYVSALFIYWVIGKSTRLTEIITNNRIINYFEKKR